MNIFVLDLFIKYTIFYLCTYLILIKVINFKIDKLNRYLIIVMCPILGLIYALIYNMVATFLSLLITFIIFTIFMKIIIRKRFSYTFVLSLLSVVISHALFLFIVFLVAIFSYNIFKNHVPTFFDYRIGDMLMIVFTFLFSKIKRLKYGITFLKDEEKIENVGFTLIPMLSFIILIILIGHKINYENINGKSLKDFILILIGISCLLIVIAINRERLRYIKDKANEETIADLNKEIDEKNNEIDYLKSIAKTNHRINHELNMLKDKYGIREVTDLSSDYSNQVKNTSVKKTSQFTNIIEVNDVLNYMMSECNKNDINFVVKINGSLNYMLERHITKEKLVTLLLDHLKDAVIAVNSSANSYKAITIIIGELEKYCGISIYDTGIEFEIDTLVKLGTKNVTTHGDDGGTGCGFMTTFDVLAETKASLVIDENKPMNGNYTKSVNIVFDRKHEYRIITYRNAQIKVADKYRRIVFVEVGK